MYTSIDMPGSEPTLSGLKVRSVESLQAFFLSKTDNELNLQANHRTTRVLSNILPSADWTGANPLLVASSIENYPFLALSRLYAVLTITGG